MKRSAAASRAETKSIADHVERRVAQRTSDLTAEIEKLKRVLTQRKRIEEQLREEELFNLIVDSIPVAVAVTSPSGEVEALNQPTLDYFGKTFEELKGWKSSDVVHPDDLQKTIAAQMEAHQAGHPYNVESRHRRADGTYRWFNVVGLPLRDLAGNILRWFILQIDIDDRKKAEEALQSAERNLNQTINTISALAWSARSDGAADFFNQHYLDYVGLSAEEASGWGWTAAVHPDDLSSLAVAWQRIMASGAPGESEARLRRFDGKYRWFLLRANPLRDESGIIVKWYGINTDIEDRKRAEAQLAGEKRLLEMVALGADLTEVLTELCKFVEATAGDCKCGVYLIDWRTANFRLGAAPGLPSTFNDPIKGLSVTSDAGPCGVAALTKSQVLVTDIDSDSRFQSATIRPLLLVHGLRAHWSTPVLSRNGEVLGTFAIFQSTPSSPTRLQQDLIAQVTHIASIAIERALSEEELRRSEAFLAEGQRLSMTGSFVWRLDTDEIRFSDELKRIFGFELGIPITLERIVERVHPNDLSLVAEKIAQARAGSGDHDYEVRLQMPDGSVKYLHTNARANRHPDDCLEFVGAMQDVTLRRLVEEALGQARSELTHATRVMSLGVLTASIAHEVNQPLSGIITNASTCVRMLDGDPPNVDGARETAKRTIRDGHRAADVIARLRALFSKQEVERELVDLNEATREVIVLSRNELERNHVVTRTELSERLPLVTGDRVQLQQVILNLLRNGSDAMSNVEDRSRELSFRTDVEEDGSVRLSVRDVGTGFETQSLEQLFQSFYTTKTDGMGIGLSVSRSIIEDHRGRLWAIANDGPGVTFSFSIPCATGYS